jgi:hypothetical protein
MRLLARSFRVTALRITRASVELASGVRPSLRGPENQVSSAFGTRAAARSDCGTLVRCLSGADPLPRLNIADEREKTVAVDKLNPLGCCEIGCFFCEYSGGHDDCTGCAVGSHQAEHLAHNFDAHFVRLSVLTLDKVSRAAATDGEVYPSVRTQA